MLSTFWNNTKNGAGGAGAGGGTAFGEPLQNRGSCCIIAFDRPNKVYWSGDTLSGQVLVVLTSDKGIKGIQMSVGGKGSCQFTMPDKDSMYGGKEVFLSERIQLADKSLTTYPAGRYAYPFRVELPSTLPTSVRDLHGFIRYSVKVCVTIPMRRDIKAREEFQVVKPLDLNLMPTLQSPLEVLAEHKFKPCWLFCCSQTDKLFLIGRISVRGYSVADAIPIELRLINETSRRVHRIKVKLSRILTYQPYEKKPNIKSSDVTVMTEETCDGCPAHSTEYQHVELIVPPLTLPTDLTSRICRIEYAVIISANAGHGRRNLELQIPITIGTEPMSVTNRERLQLENSNTSVSGMREFNSSGIEVQNYQALAIEQQYPSVDHEQHNVGIDHSNYMTKESVELSYF